MNILIISYPFYPNMGGIEVNSAILADGFCRQGHSVVVVTHFANDIDPSWDAKQKYNIVRRPHVLHFFKISRRADVILFNNPSLRYAYFSFFWPSKTFVAVRTWIARNNGRVSLVDRLKKRFVIACKDRIYVSTAIARHIRAPGHVIGNPYRDQLFLSDRPLNERHYDICFSGRLTSAKGLDVLLRSIPLIALKLDIKVAVLGEGPDRHLYESLVETLKIGQIVSFIGRKDGAALAAVVSDCKVMVVPSIWEEPFGNVALEGLGAGCYPIVSNSGGLPDAIGNYGAVVEKNNPSALADAVVAALADLSRSQQVVDSSRHYLREQTTDAVTSRYLSVLLQRT